MQQSASDSLDLRNRIEGIDKQVPLFDGSTTEYVYLDNAASTPAFTDVIDTLNAFMPWYSSVHRGTGFKSRLSTVAYDKAHEIIRQFVGADSARDSIIFTKNTTESINKLSYRLALSPDDIVLTTRMEHHSNDLPWRDICTLKYIEVTPEGRLDHDDYLQKLEEYGDRIKLVTVTGASNVTGFLQPVHWMAEKAHEMDAYIHVDAAQMAPHRRVDMKPHDDPQHLDFVSLSAHKMYAPYGSGALIGPKQEFLKRKPEYTGGGTVSLVGRNYVKWSGMPDRDEAGSPNVVGAVAMAAAAKTLMEIGMNRIADHEATLVDYALRQLKTMDGVQVYGETDPNEIDDKVGVIPFTVDGISHFKVASILGYEGGIGVRAGCFCAQPYVIQLLGLTDYWEQQLQEGIKSYSKLPGMVRMSFGCYNSTGDIDRFIDMLKQVIAGNYEGSYRKQAHSGRYLPEGFEDDFADYFEL